MKTTYTKRCGFLTKRHDISKDQFLAHWQGVHAELCMKIPGLKRYAINYIDREKFPDCPYDGFSELWFESPEAYAATQTSPEWKTLMADLPNFTGTINGVLAVERRYIWPDNDGL